LQKKAPALILAKKYGKLVLPVPAGYGFNDDKSFYFSHMLNCVYDCRYCFLQGMYRSANTVLFVNYEDFASEIGKTIAEIGEPAVFYSGYDCDSLALEPVSNFCKFFLPVFSNFPQASLELRTKSTQIRGLLETAALPNCVIAMSFTAHQAAQQWEHKVPSISKRIEALSKLQQAGWPVAIRFEPLIFGENMQAAYQKLFAEVFSKLDAATVHSVSTGLFRMPVPFYKKIVKLYPDEALFAQEIELVEGQISLKNTREDAELQELEQALHGYISPRQYYRCA
jgi:spore photoproduct lyase